MKLLVFSGSYVAFKKNIDIKCENDVRGSYVHLRGRTVMWNEDRNHLFVLIF